MSYFSSSWLVLRLKWTVSANPTTLQIPFIVNQSLGITLVDLGIILLTVDSTVNQLGEMLWQPCGGTQWCRLLFLLLRNVRTICSHLWMSTLHGKHNTPYVIDMTSWLCKTFIITVLSHFFMSLLTKSLVRHWLPYYACEPHGNIVFCWFVFMFLYS